ncbi:MAG: inositol 2-dehydrogenase [Pedosphaera sp.]|nr:inositol 2-dehydrogenase [Pedosphaera sp.]
MSNQHINIGVIGAGRIGKIHAENIATRIPGARLAAVADVNLNSARELGARFQVPLIAADCQEILKDTSIAAVAICSSSETHAQLIEDASAAGKHIFCEKPIDLKVERIKRALVAAQKAGVKLQIGFNRRFDPTFARAREFVASGKVGEVHLVRVTSRDPAPPPLEYAKQSGGLFLDMTIHDFDMVRFLTGSEVVEVFATGAALVEPDLKRLGDVDTCVVTLRLQNGAMAVIDNSRRAVYGYDQRAEVFGTHGMIEVGNPVPDAHRHLDETGEHSAKLQTFFIDRYADAYRAEMQSFVDCLRLDRPPAVSGMDGLLATMIGLAAGNSLAANRPVTLDPSELRGVS